MNYPSLKFIVICFIITVILISCKETANPPKDTTASRTTPVATATTLTNTVPLTNQMTKDVKALMQPVQSQILTLQSKNTTDSIAAATKYKKDSTMWIAKFKTQSDTINAYKNLIDGSQFKIVNGVLTSQAISDLQTQVQLLKAAKTP